MIWAKKFAPERVVRGDFVRFGGIGLAGDAGVDGFPVDALDVGFDVFGAGGLEVEEVGVFVDVHGQ